MTSSCKIASTDMLAMPKQNQNDTSNLQLDDEELSIVENGIYNLDRTTTEINASPTNDMDVYTLSSLLIEVIKVLVGKTDATNDQDYRERLAHALRFLEQAKGRPPGAIFNDITTTAGFLIDPEWLQWTGEIRDIFPLSDLLLEAIVTVLEMLNATNDEDFEVRRAHLVQFLDGPKTQSPDALPKDMRNLGRMLTDAEWLEEIRRVDQCSTGMGDEAETEGLINRAGANGGAEN